MNQVAVIDHQQVQPRPVAVRSVLMDMATRYGMEPAAFEATVRATCIQKASREEFAAFLLVAKEYRLNPLTKEIYAFPAKGGGIVPVVSIDGWINLINSHPACDGFEFDWEHDQDGKLVSCTCRMYRKDRSRPVIVTEYLEECKRNTEPWKMLHRMLRHKSLIQAGRYAFGFSGIYDEDEAAKIAESRIGARDEPPAPPSVQIVHQSEEVPSTPAEELVTVQAPDEPVEWNEVTEPEAATEQPPEPPEPPQTKKPDPISTGRVANDFPGDKPIKPADDGLDIPPALRRTAPKKEAAVTAEWLTSLSNALSGCEDTDQLREVQEKYQSPMQGKVPAAEWDQSRNLILSALERITESE
jgi:phage recombination protein Bet